MLNLRVTDIDGMIVSLSAAGIEVATNPEWDAPASAASPASPIPRATRSSSGSRTNDAFFAVDALRPCRG